MDKGTRRALSELAARQRGLFSAAQAAQLGLGSSQLSRARTTGALRRVARGVYSIAGSPRSRWEHIIAAALAAGPDAVISHGSAAAVHRLQFGSCEGVELTFSNKRRFKWPGATVHCRSDLSPADIVRRRGLLVTSPARTIVDLSGRLGPCLTQRVLDEALIAHKLVIDDLQACLSRTHSNIPGRATLDALVAQRCEGPSADSALEQKVIDILAPLRPFVVHHQVIVGPSVYVIDIAWPESHVGLEVVCRGHRVASRSAFDRERRKLNDLVAAGWYIGHATSAMSKKEVLAVARRLLVAGGGGSRG